MTGGSDAAQRVEDSQYVAQAREGSQASVTINQYYQQGLQRPAVVSGEELAAARARLQALPLDHVPDPAPLPAGSHMPLLPNALFVGRAPELLALARALKSGVPAAVGQAIITTGLGGIGKTQLASAFAFRYGQFFAGGMFWLSFAQADAVPAEIARCGRPLALNLQPGYDHLALPDQLGLVATAFAAELPRLLVFDNCEDEALLATWLPRTGAARVLVTSRRREWSADLSLRAVPIGVLPRVESVALLRKFRDGLPADNPDLNAIAEELGDMPLALHMAGSFLKRYRYAITPAGYVAELKAPGLLDHPSLTRALEHSPTAHEQHVARTFALSLDKLDPSDPADALARYLLDRAGFFAPGEPIPRALLMASAGVEAGDRFAGEDVLRRLTDLGLIEDEADGAVRLHRLLAAFVRARCKDADSARAAVEAALAEEASRLNEAGLPAAVVALQPHLRSVAATADAARSEHAGMLFNELGDHLQIIHDLASANVALQRAIAIDEKIFGLEHPKVATAIHNLGKVLYAQRHLAGAKAHYQRALTIDEKAYGPEHPNVGRDLNSLAGMLADEGDLASARANAERALKITIKAFGPEHTQVAAVENTLALVLQDQGDLTNAETHFTRSLEIVEKIFGPEHPSVAIRLNNIGVVLKDKGVFAEAIKHFTRALNIAEKALGPDDVGPAMYAHNIASVLKTEGNLDAAKAHYQRALDVFRKVHGPNHPSTLKVARNLVRVLAEIESRQQGGG